MATKKIKSTEQAWDSRELGADEANVMVADEADEVALDEALGLVPISIRLPKKLVDQYKLIAHFHGMGYQPLMREVLTRFTPGALREIVETQLESSTQAAAKSEMVSLKKAA